MFTGKAMLIRSIDMTYNILRQMLLVHVSMTLLIICSFTSNIQIKELDKLFTAKERIIATELFNSKDHIYTITIKKADSGNTPSDSETDTLLLLTVKEVIRNGFIINIIDNSIIDSVRLEGRYLAMRRDDSRIIIATYDDGESRIILYVLASIQMQSRRYCLLLKKPSFFLYRISDINIGIENLFANTTCIEMKINLDGLYLFIRDLFSTDLFVISISLDNDSSVPLYSVYNITTLCQERRIDAPDGIIENVVSFNSDEMILSFREVYDTRVYGIDLDDGHISVRAFPFFADSVSTGSAMQMHNNELFCVYTDVIANGYRVRLEKLLINEQGDHEIVIPILSFTEDDEAYAEATRPLKLLCFDNYFLMFIVEYPVNMKKRSFSRQLVVYYGNYIVNRDSKLRKLVISDRISDNIAIATMPIADAVLLNYYDKSPSWNVGHLKLIENNL